MPLAVRFEAGALRLLGRLGRVSHEVPTDATGKTASAAGDRDLIAARSEP